jgi:sulfur carrier protein
MNLLVNGEPVPVEPGTTVADLLDHTDGRAVAVNGEVVPRTRHHLHALADGDVVEIVTAVQGG